jgi:hypothetical protein
VGAAPPLGAVLLAADDVLVAGAALDELEVALFAAPELFDELEPQPASTAASTGRARRESRFSFMTPQPI